MPRGGQPRGRLMSPSSPPVAVRQRLARARRRSRARTVPPKRAAVRPRILAIRYALAVTAVWLIACGAYMAFRDDGLGRLIEEQTALQLTYEDRIAELRTQVDRIVSQKLLDQEQVEQRVNSLLQRQARMSLSLDNVEQKQVAALTDLGERIDMRARQMQTVLADLGVKVGRAPADTGTGGPFVPVKPPPSEASAFEAQLHRINAGRAQMDFYNRALAAVPVRTPVTGESDLTSPFGIRIHPILKRIAMHAGIDLRGDLGETVRATATGKVTLAGRQRGYGNVVEISHGNGLTTRFGHLSEISVKVGQVVRIGEVVGKIGSTGLSTGPHLHYETRINGKAVDPQKFLRAGSTLGED
jgi:murein DD-endopeptidase MepM/ murein hydrolase activator NlpD